MKLVSSLKRLAGLKSGSLKRGWVFKTDSKIAGGLAIGDLKGNGKEIIVFGTSSGSIFALEDRGRLVWVHHTKHKISDKEALFLDSEEPNAITKKPCLYDINNDNKLEIIFGCDNGLLYALDSSGKELWSFDAGSPIRTTPIAGRVGGSVHIIFGCDNHKLYILDTYGKEVSMFSAESPIRGDPNIFGDDIFFGTEEGYLYSIKKDCSVNWKFKAMHAVETRPELIKINKKESIVFGSFDGCIYVLNNDGKVEWQYPIDGSITSDIAFADINKDGNPEIIFGASDGNVYALKSNGNKFWKFGSSMWVVAKPLVKDIDGDGKEEVIFGSYDKKAYILDSEGKFLTDYIPGLSCFTAQLDHYSDIITKDPGTIAGSKLWDVETTGRVTGLGITEKKKKPIMIVSTLNGNIEELILEL